MYNFEEVADEARAFVSEELEANTRHDKIVMALCEMYGMEWNFADRFVLDVAAEESHKHAASAGIILAIALLLPLLLAALTLLGALVLGGTFRDRALLLAILVGGGGLGVALIGIVLYSTYQNANKEKYRCPHCGFLANAQGTEESLFLPQFKAFTYHIHEQATATTHGRERRRRPRNDPAFNRREPAVNQDTFRHVEVQEICRNCKEVAHSHTKRVKVSSAPRRRDDHHWD